MLRTTTAALVSLAAVAGASCSGDDDTGVDGQVAIELDPNTVVGECLRFPETQDATVTTLPFVGCADEHTHEIYYVSDDADDGLGADDEYPGFGELEDLARILCLGEFRGYTGQDPFESDFFFTWIVPTLESWNDEDLMDRQVLCLLGPRDGGTTFGSQRQT